MYPFSHFYVRNSASLAAFTLLCNALHSPSPELVSSSPTAILYPVKQKFPLTPSLQPWCTILLSVCMDLTILGPSRKWSHKIFVLL